jgi:hypothetical protein
LDDFVVAKCHFEGSEFQTFFSKLAFIFSIIILITCLIFPIFFL